MNFSDHVFVFDCESIGLYGEVFAVAGGVYRRGLPIHEFCYACPRDHEDVYGTKKDREWVDEHVPSIHVTHESPEDIRRAFWKEWMWAKKHFHDISIWAECLWPIEARFVVKTVCDDFENRTWEGPYPFHEISTAMHLAGMDPMKTYTRKPLELPNHHPLADTRLSARLLSEALEGISSSSD